MSGGRSEFAITDEWKDGGRGAEEGQELVWLGA